MRNLKQLVAFLAILTSSYYSYAQPGNYTIETGTFFYTPQQLLEIEAGSTVTWINIGGFHDVNFETNSITNLSFNNPEEFSLNAVYSAGPSSPVEIGSWTFNTVGTYTYDCSVGNHASQGMVGTISVIPQGEYPGCMDNTTDDGTPIACNYNPIANIDDGSCLYGGSESNCLCTGIDLICVACQACQTPEEFCLANPGYNGCDAYDVYGCMDDGFQAYSPFPGVAADNYAEGANTPCNGCCAYWGCGNPDNTLMLVGTFMDLSGQNGWNGTSMTVYNTWDGSSIYEVGDTVFHFSPTASIMYPLPPLPTVDIGGNGFDETGSPEQLLSDGSNNPDYNPNYGDPIPDGEIDHDDCLICPLNPDYVGELGYVVNFCAPDDLLDGCYNLVVDGPDQSLWSDIAWQIQNAEISVFALTGSAPFNATSGSACTDDPDDSGFDFYDVGVNTANLDNGILTTQICNYGTETTANEDDVETAGTTWILIDGFAEISESPSELIAINPTNGNTENTDGYFWGSCYDFTYDISGLLDESVLGPGNHTVTIWVNGGVSQPLGVNPEFTETNYENNYFTIAYDIPYIYGCLDPWASNYNPNANSDNDGNEPCYYICGDTTGDGAIDNNNFESFDITCGGGSWLGEVSWTIQTIDGFEVLSGEAPYSSNEYSQYGLCLAEGCYQVILNDSFGDGWNGNELTIGDDLEFTIPSGFDATYIFSVGENNNCANYLGCTDINAENYDSGALDDDGSCTYDCSEFLDDNNDEYESISISVNGGSDQDEISWEIVDQNNVVITSGGAPYNQAVCVPIGCYTINMSDSYGDGWNDNIMTILTGGGFTYTASIICENLGGCDTDSGTFATGNPNDCGIYFGCTDENATNYNIINTNDDGSCQYDCNNGGTPVSIICDGGDWQSEIAWTILDANGLIVMTGGAPFSEDGVCLEDGCYSINMIDSNGDGWEGNELIINGDNIDLEFSASGDGGTAAFGINNSSCVTEGCTDETAENYDELANMDNGSCYYDCDTWLDTEELYTCYWYVWVWNGNDYTVSQMEGFGFDCTCVIDPIDGCMNPDATNYNSEATSDDGSCLYACDENQGEITTLVTCDGGTWQYEISWQIYDENNVLIASGGAPYSNEICLLEDECYTIEMQDSYGDGWNNNILNIGGEEVSLYAGQSGILDYNCDYDCDYSEIPVSVQNGNGTSFGFSITNSSGDIVVTGGNDFSGTLCLDPSECYNINLANASGGGDSGAILIVGNDEYNWVGPSSWYAYHYEVIGSNCPIYGCTDGTSDDGTPVANNYDADATVNEISATDSSNPCLYFGCTDSAASNYDSIYNYNDGSCTYECSEGLSAYLISCDGGTWQYEVSWQIINENGAIVEAGGAPTNTGICLADGCYTINMYDSYGDGWNGNTLTLGDFTYEGPGSDLGAGDYVTETFVAGLNFEDCGVIVGCTDSEATNYNASNTYDDGSCVYNCVQPGWESVTLVCDGGQYQYELAWDITDSIGNVIFSAGEVGNLDYDFDESGIVNTWTCLDPNACYTINMSDDYGDGWNGNTLVIDGDTEFSLYAGYEGTYQYGNCDSECTNTTLDVLVNNGLNTDFAFTITDYSGTTVVSGGNDFSGTGCFDFVNGCYTISLSSSSGGGQGAASLSIGDYNFTWNDGTGGYWSSSIVNILGEGCPVFGCIDNNACNFNSEADEDDGSCWYADDCINYCISEAFDYTDGTGISTTNFFNTWSDDTSQEAYVDNGKIVITSGDDIITANPLLNTGTYEISFDMGISTGESGYFNLGNSGNPDNWQWEIEVFLNNDGTGYTTQSYEIWDYAYGTTISVYIIIDLDNEQASLQINGNCVENWDWTGNLGGLNFYGATNGDEYTVDNFNFCASNLAVCLAGCTDDNAFNYNSDATEDDGSCIDVVLGCNNPDALNYNPNANTDDGSCINTCADIGYDEVSINIFTNGVVSGWYGNSINIGNLEFELGNAYQQTIDFCIDLDNCIDVSVGGGIQQYNIGWDLTYANGDAIESGGSPFTGQIGTCAVYGCTDGGATEDGDNISACNYNPLATNNNNSCIYPNTGFNCDGTCIDTDGDGTCDLSEILGCTDPNAANYIQSATEEDGSCTYAIYGCTDDDAFNFNENANTNQTSITDSTDPCYYGPWGEVPNGFCSMNIAFPDNLEISLEGSMLSEAWIGAVDSDGNICGVVFWTSGVTTAISLWEDTEETAGEQVSTFGFNSGETINWIVSTNDGDVTGNPVFLQGSNTFSCNGLAVMSSINFADSNTQYIELYTGWGIWSTYIDPSNPNFDSVFDQINSNLIIVKDEDGDVYWPLFGLNSIGDLTWGKGYQVKMSANDTLVIEGNLIPSDYNLQLLEGWGLVGYLHQNCYSANNMMLPVVNQLTILKDEDGDVYWPLFGLNSVGDLCPDKGYQVKMNADVSFSYPSGTSASRLGFDDSYDLVERNVNYEKPVNTGNNMIIGLPTTSWSVMPAIGDEIAAYDESDRLIGSTTFNGDHIALTVWGDDLTTNSKDGLTVGEKMTFKLWNADMNTESALVVTKWDEGNDIYAIDGISVASNIVLSSETSLDAYKLYQNEPNPFNGTTTIKFYVPESTEVSISVYNMLGEHVSDVTSDMFNAGEHSVVFDANNHRQGTYFVRMITDSFTATKNMNIVK